ncbi:MAG: mechanosensitive ion channel family protein [bacterium]|nr:mechanosensitive ion channel family protein [bacterium]
MYDNYIAWFNKNDELIIRAVKYVVILFCIMLLIRLVKRYFTRNIPSTTVRYKSVKSVQTIGLVLIVILTISFFTGNVRDFTLAIGLLSAGVAFALQELILSIAGSIYIFVLRVYKPGDRIEINKIKGDVIDVDTVYTTMMEIGEWVDSDNYSGRIVKVSNAFVFKSAVYNYSQDFPFVWDEINIPIDYNSDLEKAEEIINVAAKEVLSEYTETSKKQWKEIVKKYFIEDAQLDPTVAVKITDNWLQINLRYIVDFKKRRITKTQLYDRIAKSIAATNGQVKIGSTTLDIINNPTVDVRMKGQDKNG